MEQRQLTIAVIDDDDSVRVALQELLRAAGVRALGFSSGEEFLELAGGSSADCLIVDVNLPGMSGVALVRALRDTGVASPVVLISARDDARTLALVRATAAPFLRKPFGDDELLAGIARAMAGASGDQSPR
jgi:FixJ family two-component response regulator